MLLLVALRFDHELNKIAFFYHKHNRVSFTSVKVSGFRTKMGGKPFFQAPTTGFDCDRYIGEPLMDSTRQAAD